MIKGGKAMLSGVNCQRLGERLGERFGNCLGVKGWMNGGVEVWRGFLTYWVKCWVKELGERLHERLAG